MNDLSGELQTIPARHGVATFVPRGRTIKVINTYGQQVIAMWAFALGAPPEEGEMDEKGPVRQKAEEQEQKGGDEPKKNTEKAGSENVLEIAAKGNEVSGEETSKKDAPKDEVTIEDVSKEGEAKEGEAKEGEAKEESKEDSKKDAKKDAKEETKDASPQTETSESTPTNPRSKRNWTSYLPSIPYRSKNKSNGSGTEQKINVEAEKAQNEAKTKKWSSYLPTGQGFSSYVPNVDSTSIVSAFKASHYRDPNKSYAEQLYDFSKTPVGAGTIAVATGSGYASSVYAAYNAYTQMNYSKSSLPPMEYLSLPHTRATSHKLVPSVDDTLLTNLRNPIITLVEDTTPGAHDTLTAACDANLYATLGVDAPAEHGSCAENLVLALKEMNAKSGLKGAKAVGADISVNIAPTPLHLFMNAPLQLPESAQSNGTGAKGATFSVAAPMAKKRSFVRFRAERDVVVVFSACPMDIGPQNGGRCMAANFMVEEAKGEDLAASYASIKEKKARSGIEKKEDKKMTTTTMKEATKKEDDKEVATKKQDVPERDSAPRKDSVATTSEALQAADKNNPNLDTKPAQPDPLKKRKKPKKLEVRSAGTPTPPAKPSS